MISLDEANRWIEAFGAAQKHFMRSEQRAALRSILFDVPRRSSLGWHCFYQESTSLLRELTKNISPEEIGRRMKRLCSRPYYLTLSILMCSYFGARQQHLLDRGLSPGDPLPEEGEEKIADARLVVDFWKRTCQAYRNDDALLPDEAGFTQPVLPEAVVDDLDARLTPTSPAQHRKVRKLAATLELYSFILHGEQRDGIFAHGPYPRRDGTQLIILEFTDLQNDFLPWASTQVPNPFPNVAVALRLRGVQARFSMFGGVVFEPSDVGSAAVAEGLFTRREQDEKVQAIDFDQIASVQHAAAEAQNELYLRAAEWSPRFKAEYGVYLFANHLRTFFRIAGMPQEWDEIIRRRFQRAAEPVIDAMLSRSDPPSIWPFMANTESTYFWPVVEHAHQQNTTSTGR